MDALHEQMLDVIASLAEFPAVYVEFIDSLTGHMTNPRLFEELCLPQAFRLGEGVYVTQPGCPGAPVREGIHRRRDQGPADLMDAGPENLDEVLLAGSFGTFVNPASAMISGLAPPVETQRILAVGNAAEEGAKMALLSFREQQIGFGLPARIEYVELSSSDAFNELFLSSLQFPELEAVS